MKILFVTTISNTVNAFLIPHIRILVEKGHQVDVAFSIVQEPSPELKKLNCEVFNIGFQRSPFKIDNYYAYKRIKKLILSQKYDIVHAHTPVASFLTRIATKNITSLKVIYTAHGFHFFKGAPIYNWLIYYPIERLLSRYTDVLITINNEDYERAKKFKAKRVYCVSGVGIDTDRFSKADNSKDKIRDELGIPRDAIMLINIGELNKNKNHKTVILAVDRLNNPNLYYVICGIGNLHESLNNLCKKLKLSDKVKFAGFRDDIADVCNASDIFVFSSYREGLPVSLMEAMASSLPCIASKIRGNIDLLADGKGGYLIEPNNVEGFANAIRTIINDPGLKKQMGKYNFESVKQFSINKVKTSLIDIYNSICEGKNG